MEHLQTTIQAAEIGSLSIHFDEHWNVVLDNNCSTLLGLNGVFNVSYATFLSYIDPNDRDHVDAAFKDALNPQNTGALSVKCRISGVDNNTLRFVHFAGCAYLNPSGFPERFTGVCIDIDAQVFMKEEELRAQQDLIKKNTIFKDAINISPSGFWISDTEGKLTFANKKLADMRGVSPESLLGTGWINSIIKEDKQKSINAFTEAFNARVHYEAEFRIHAADGSIKWCHAEGDPFYHDDGIFAGYSGFCMDINNTVKILDHIQKSESNIRSIIEQAPVALVVLRGKEMILEFANDIMLNLWAKDSAILEMPIIQALPELEGQPFMDILNKVYTTGEPYYGYETITKLQHKEKLVDFYFDFVYSPLKDQQGKINGILSVASDVTKQVTAKKLLEESEARFRSLIEESPIPTAVYIGPELIVAIANKITLKIWGKGDKVFGMPLAKVLPELDGQPFVKILQDVLNTKKTYIGKEERIEFVIDGVLQTSYFNYTCNPLFDSAGNVYGVMSMAINVTDDVLHANEIAQAETRLQLAVESANVATWEMNLLTYASKSSSRMKEWFGFDAFEEMTLEGALECVEDKNILIAAVQKAKDENSDGLIDIEYTVKNKTNKQKYILHTVGKRFLNDNQEPSLLTCWTSDITLQRKTEYELEKKVALRTQQLQLMNEKLTESNSSLFRSNHELSQYAYIASHDLQEPLRKIQMFSNMLTTKFDLGQEKLLISKISQASERMRLLIKDLLEFSKLQGAEKMTRPIQLSDVVYAVINDFELIINEKQAKIEIELDTLPIEAVALQMNQLFYNLLGNALKFTKQGIEPQIKISSKKITVQDAEHYIPKAQKDCTYYDITISDNGIGFEVKYADHIFEVFKRLHTRDIYPGSGIGLALCRRIVSNHGGHLYAESEPEKGSVFHIILPDKH